MDYQVMPDLCDDEYRELKEDIARRGVMVPVEFDEYGNVLDGHHRLKVCEELGIKDYPKVIRAGMTEEEKRTHARKLNMARRQLSQEQRRELIRQQLRETPEKSDRQIAAGLGVTNKTVAAQRKGLERTEEIPQLKTNIGADGKERPRQVQRKPVSIFNPSKREERAVQNPAVVERMAEGGSAISVAKQIAKEEKADRKKFVLPDTFPAEMCRLYMADIRDGLPMIEDESVDYIITDPPYPKEYIPLYEDLSRLAQRVLKANGSMIVMVGQSYLPEVMRLLGKHMNYHWCLAYLTPGGQSPQLWHKRTNTFWKPVLWYTKGEYIGDYIGDVLKSPPNDNDKQFHEWGQSLGGMEDIVERFTNPGEVILDPFAGGGTTGVAAVLKGRKFIGADIARENIEITEKRVREAYAGSKAGKNGLAGRSIIQTAPEMGLGLPCG